MLSILWMLSGVLWQAASQPAGMTLEQLKSRDQAAWPDGTLTYRVHKSVLYRSSGKWPSSQGAGASTQPAVFYYLEEVTKAPGKLIFVRRPDPNVPRSANPLASPLQAWGYENGEIREYFNTNLPPGDERMGYATVERAPEENRVTAGLRLYSWALGVGWSKWIKQINKEVVLGDGRIQWEGMLELEGGDRRRFVFVVDKAGLVREATVEVKHGNLLHLVSVKNSGTFEQEGMRIAAAGRLVESWRLLGAPSPQDEEDFSVEPVRFVPIVRDSNREKRGVDFPPNTYLADYVKGERGKIESDGTMTIYGRMGVPRGLSGPSLTLILVAHCVLVLAAAIGWIIWKKKRLTTAG